MKVFICFTAVLIMMLMSIGCASMSSEERKETYDLRKNVGDRPFVGASSPDAAKYMYSW